MTHSTWITDNYHFLEKWGKIWGKNNWGELINHYVEYLDSHWEKFDSIPDNQERLKWTQTWMKNQTYWTNSDFRRKHQINNLPDEYDIPDESEDHLLELKCDTNSDDLGLWLIDIHTEWGDEGADKLIKIREVYLRLDLHEKVLYDLYYTNMNTMREISSKLDIPLTAVFKMVKNLTNKIKIELCLK